MIIRSRAGTAAAAGRFEPRVAVAALSLAVRAARAPIALYLLTSIGAGLAPVVIAWLTKVVLDRVAERSPGGLSALLPVVVALVGVGVLAAVLPHLSAYASAEVDRRLTQETQGRLYSTVSALPGLGRLEDPSFYDRLMLAQHAGGGPGRVMTGMFGVAQAGLTMSGFLVTLVVVAPVMAAAVVIAVAPALFAERALNYRRVRLMERLGVSERRELFYAHLMRDLKAAKEVRLFGIGSYLRDKMLTELVAIHAARRRLDRRALGTQGALAVLTAAVAGGGLIWASSAASDGALSVGDVAMFVAAVAGTQSSLSSLIRSASVAHEALLGFAHYDAVVNTPPDLLIAARTRPVPPLSTGIELRDVWFRYGDDQPWVLKGIDLRIPCGRAVALVGHNGTGKSTLVKLLCRLYEPTKGTIRWDGVDLREFDPAELRERLSVVFQDYMCYDLTARENIGIGNVSLMSDAAMIERAARRAGVHDDIAALPRRYETLLSRMFPDAADDGTATSVLLSGGQWQRVAIARAFLRDRRDLLILDEPSAGLDAEAEHQLHRRLKEHRAGRTSLLISHRLGAIRDADLIVVMRDGRVGEMGTHHELLAADRGYARLFRLQSEGYRDDVAQR